MTRLNLAVFCLGIGANAAFAFAAFLAGTDAWWMHLVLAAALAANVVSRERGQTL